MHAAAADLEQAVVAVFLKLLFIPNLEIQIRFFSDLARSLREILRCGDRARLIDSAPSFVYRFGHNRVPIQVMPIRLLMPLQCDQLDLNLLEIRLLFFVPVETITAEDGPFHGFAQKRYRLGRVQQDGYPAQTVIPSQVDRARHKRFEVFPDVVAGVQRR